MGKIKVFPCKIAVLNSFDIYNIVSPPSPKTFIAFTYLTVGFCNSLQNISHTLWSLFWRRSTLLSHCHITCIVWAHRTDPNYSSHLLIQRRYAKGLFLAFLLFLAYYVMPYVVPHHANHRFPVQRASLGFSFQMSFTHDMTGETLLRSLLKTSSLGKGIFLLQRDNSSRSLYCSNAFTASLYRWYFFLKGKK